MFRAFQTQLDNTGNGSVNISPYVESSEWDIYQVSVQTGALTGGCTCTIAHNGFFMCASSQGSQDSAYGPPDVVVLPSDQFTVTWAHGKPNDTGTAGIWYNENPTGTTYSSSH